MPLAPPVMTATLPSRRPGISAPLRALRPRLGWVLLALRGDVDVLDLCVVVEGVRPELAPDAGLLHPAEGRRDAHRGVGVYREDPGLYAAGHPEGAGAVAGPDRAREAVDRVVRLQIGRASCR